MFPNLFKPLDPGPVTLPNRICFLGHRTHFNRNEKLYNRYLNYYLRRARGVCGLIILGELSIHNSDRPRECIINVLHPGAIDDFSNFTDKINFFDITVGTFFNRGFRTVLFGLFNFQPMKNS